MSFDLGEDELAGMEATAKAVLRNVSSPSIVPDCADDLLLLVSAYRELLKVARPAAVVCPKCGLLAAHLYGPLRDRRS